MHTNGLLIIGFLGGVIEQNADRRCIVVIKMSLSDRPDEGAQEADCYEKAGDNQDIQGAHGCIESGYIDGSKLPGS